MLTDVTVYPLCALLVAEFGACKKLRSTSGSLRVINRMPCVIVFNRYLESASHFPFHSGVCEIQVVVLKKREDISQLCE